MHAHIFLRSDKLVNMLTAHDLACMRGDRLLFKGIDLELKAGGLLHVQGENGIGKSSLLRILCGLLPAEHGSVAWHGEDIRRADAYRAELLYIGHLNALKDDLSAAENLFFSSNLNGSGRELPQIHAALQAAGLVRCAELPVRQLSQGQKRRVSLARLWLNNATLWVLDEPFAALDKTSIEIVVRRINEHLAAGGMAILATHQEVEISAAIVQQLRLTP